MYVQTYQCKYISDRLRGQELQSLFSTFVKNTHGSKIHYKSTLYTQLKIYFSIAKSMCFSNPENPIVIWQKKFCPYWHKFTRDRLQGLLGQVAEGVPDSDAVAGLTVQHASMLGSTVHPLYIGSFKPHSCDLGMVPKMKANKKTSRICHTTVHGSQLLLSGMVPKMNAIKKTSRICHTTVWKPNSVEVRENPTNRSITSLPVWYWRTAAWSPSSWSAPPLPI